ncbi:hypothetical protein JXD38_08130 [candidate division WOR-3 bacterium]|nr:hypothetical protein [candidate division WOR-3 bacterium]
MKHLLIVLALVLVSAASAELRITDYDGAVKATKVNLDSVRNSRSFRVDVDGDGKKDSVELYFEQSSYSLVCYDGRDKVWIAGFDVLSEPTYVEFAPARVIGPDKPVVVVKFSTGVQMVDSLYIVDVIRTAAGLKSSDMLRCSAAWGDAPTIVKPGFVEIQHFRGWPMTRYLWDGDKYIVQQVEK